MGGVARDLATTMPSPSEVDSWDTCQYLWWMRWRQGIERVEPPIHLLNGRFVSDAMEAFYLRTGDPLKAYAASVEKAEKAGELDASAVPWQELQASTVDVLKVYLDTRPRDFFGKVIGCQVRFTDPVPARLDLIALNEESGRYRIVDQKLVSPFVDLEYENMKYNLAVQPGLYFACATKAGYDVEAFVVDYLVRSAPARGRYKALPPIVPPPHEVPYEEWLAEMAVATAMNASVEMAALVESVYGAGDGKLSRIPRRTRNCLVRLGSKTYPCPLYQACSVNMHPLQVDGVYRELHPVEKIA